MKRRSIRNYLVIAISFFVLTFPSYLLFSSFSQMNFFRADLNFENFDQDCQLKDQVDESDLFLISALPIKSFLGFDFLEQSYCSSLAVPSLIQKTCHLRC